MAIAMAALIHPGLKRCPGQPAHQQFFSLVLRRIHVSVASNCLLCVCESPVQVNRCRTQLFQRKGRALRCL